MHQALQRGLLALAASGVLHAPRGLLAQVPDRTPLVAGLHYAQTGTGSPLVLVHGFGVCAATLPFLADSLGTEYRVIAPDLPGHGGSKRPTARFSFKQAARVLNEFLDSLHLDQVRAVGISAGAVTLLHAAAQRPRLYQRLVIVSGGTTFAPEAKRVLQGTRTVDDFPPLVRSAWTGCEQAPGQLDWLIQQYRSLADDTSDIHLSADELKAITSRLLFVSGDRDPLFRVEEIVALQRATPVSALWVVPFGAHVPIFGRQLSPFLAMAKAFLAAP